MTDDDRLLLASALLDGELSADERARLDADAALRAAVETEAERLREQREQLLDVEPTAISTREVHLAAALDLFDQLPTPGSAAASAGRASAGRGSGGTGRGGGRDGDAVVALDRQRRTRSGRSWRPIAMSAAAAVAVVAAGGIVLQNLGSGDDQLTAETSADAADNGVLESEVDLNAERAAGALSADEATAFDLPVEEPADEPADEPAEAPASDFADEPAEEPASDPAAESAVDASPVGDGETTVEVSPPAENDEIAIDSIDALLDYARDAQAARGLGVSADSETGDDRPDNDDVAASETTNPIEITYPLCPELGIDFLVVPAQFFGEPALIGIDDDTETVIVYGYDCSLIEQLPLEL